MPTNHELSAHLADKETLLINCHSSSWHIQSPSFPVGSTWTVEAVDWAPPYSSSWIPAWQNLSHLKAAIFLQLLGNPLPAAAFRRLPSTWPELFFSRQCTGIVHWECLPHPWTVCLPRGRQWGPPASAPWRRLFSLEGEGQNAEEYPVKMWAHVHRILLCGPSPLLRQVGFPTCGFQPCALQASPHTKVSFLKHRPTSQAPTHLMHLASPTRRARIHGFHDSRAPLHLRSAQLPKKWHWEDHRVRKKTIWLKGFFVPWRVFTNKEAEHNVQKKRFCSYPSYLYQTIRSSHFQGGLSIYYITLLETDSSHLKRWHPKKGSTFPTINVSSIFSGYTRED